MFRAAVFSIVLTLVAGPNASLLCAVWCHPQAATAGPCEHPTPTSAPSLRSNDSCPDVTAPSMAVAREDVRRGGSAPDPHAVDAAPFQFASQPRVRSSVDEAARVFRFDARPLVLALRI